jgi:molybdenum cofactor synthesis domain-containing protein
MPDVTPAAAGHHDHEHHHHEHREHEHHDQPAAAPVGQPGPGDEASPQPPAQGLAAKVLTASDGVVAGTRVDRSGEVLAEALQAAGFTIADRRVVADGVDSVGRALRELAQGFAGLIVTTGGTGFGPRDLTPEATRSVIEREAPGLAEATRAINPGPGRLSRGVAGTVGRALILNTPGSPKGAQECLDAVLDVLPHALKLLADQPTEH